MDKLILADNTAIDLEAGASLADIRVKAADRAAMAATWGKLTPDNLKSVRIKTEEGLTAGTYADLALVSETSSVAADGSVLTSYRLRAKTPEELRLDALEESQKTQDGAIMDVATVAGGLAEAAKGGKG